jgi:hypothetical protein
MKTEFVLVVTGQFFEPLADVLNDDIVDAVWTALFVTEPRKDVIDYVFNSYSTAIVIGASPEVGSDAPDPKGPQMNVAFCGAICDFQVPPPFTMLPLVTGSIEIY